MLAIIAKLNVVPGKGSEFEKVMLGLVKDVRANESGNKLYTLTKNEAGEYFVLEIYDNEAALEAHRGRARTSRPPGPKFAGLMTGRPDLTDADRGRLTHCAPRAVSGAPAPSAPANRHRTTRPADPSSRRRAAPRR